MTLFEPIDLRTTRARNRIVVSPMCQYSAADGVPGEWHFVHLGSRAVGGAGIVFAEATAVTPEGRISPFDLGLWSAEQERAFARIAQFVAAQGALPGIQLAHAGRKASHRRPWEHRTALTQEEGGWTVLGPSPIPWEDADIVPREMSAVDFEQVVEAFRSSAKRALRAGFKVLEIHGAHGYLLHSFLSPISNARTDAYGGSFQNRVRLPVQVVEAVREVWPPELALFYRVSGTDWTNDGWSLDDTVAFAQLVGPLGVDVIDCSSGGSSREAIDAYPGYQVPIASRVRSEAGVMTAAVGLLNDPIMVAALVEEGQADLVALGRAALWDPYWPHHAADALGLGASLPIQYERSSIYARRV